MIYVIIIRHAKFSYSLIESQLVPCAPACSYKFHALAVYLFTYLQHLSSRRCILSPVKHLWWSFFVEVIDAIFAEELHHGCFTGF